MKNKLLLLILILIVNILLACGGDGKAISDSEAKKSDVLVIGFVQVGAESAWRMANTESFKEAFDFKQRYDFRFFDSQNNPTLQQTAVYDFIAQEVDYIILAPIEEYGWDEILAEARDAGIPVILTDRMIETDDDSLFVTWVGGDFLKEGLDAIKWLENYLISIGRDNKPLNVFHMQGTIGSSPQLGRTEGISTGIANNENLILKAQETGDFTIAKGQEVMEQWLRNYPLSKIDILIAENDDMAFGAIRAMQAFGIKPGEDIIIISFDAGKEAVQAVADGLINCTIESNPIHGRRVRQIVEFLDAGAILGKRSYVNNGMFFDINNAADEVINRF